MRGGETKVTGFGAATPLCWGIIFQSRLRGTEHQGRGSHSLYGSPVSGLPISS